MVPCGGAKSCLKIKSASPKSVPAERSIYVSFVSKAILWERVPCASVHKDHSVPHQGPLLCSRFLSHMKARPEDLKPSCFLSSKHKTLPPCQEKLYTHSSTARKSQKLDGHFDLKANKRYGNFHQEPVTRQSTAAVAPRPYLRSATPTLPQIKPKPCGRINPGSERPQDDHRSTALSFPQTLSSVEKSTVFKKGEADNTNSLIKLYPGPTELDPPRSPASPCQSSMSDLSRPTSLSSRSVDLTSDRSSTLSDKILAESWNSGLCPEGIICTPPVHSSHVLKPLEAPRHTSLPLYSPTNLSTSSLISAMFNGQTKAPLLPLSSPVAVCEPEDNEAHAPSLYEEAHVEFGRSITPPHCTRSSSDSSPRMPSAGTLSVKLSPSPPVCGPGSLWPVLPPISTVQEWCNTADCCSSDVSCSQSDVFDELDAIAPLSASSSSMDQLSESSYSAPIDTDVSPGLAALTVGCDSGNLGSLSRVQLLLLNRQEPDSASPFSLDEDMLSLDHYTDLEINRGSSDNEEAPFDMQSNCLRLYEEGEDTYKKKIKRIEEDQVRKREERKTKVLKMLSKLQDDSPHQPTSCEGHSNFEDFDFLAKYCIFNKEKLAEYKRAFEEEDTDGDGYISCLQVLFALKSIIPPELLSEEEEIYVYRILEMVDFRVTDGLVDLRLFAVIASLAQKIATMDEFMRSLISTTDFRSLEVKLFKAKKLFLFLLEEQAGDAMSQQKYISPEQLILELKAGGICLEQEAAIRVELQRIPPLDLLGFLAYLPLFMLIHKSVIANPLDDFCHL